MFVVCEYRPEVALITGSSAVGVWKTENSFPVFIAGLFCLIALLLYNPQVLKLFCQSVCVINELHS